MHGRNAVGAVFVKRLWCGCLALVLAGRLFAVAPTGTYVPCAALGNAIVGDISAPSNSNGTVMLNAQTVVDSYNSDLGAYGATLAALAAQIEEFKKTKC